MSWLKFDTATPEKPEVMALTVAMGWDDPDLTVGKLLKVWRWFDQHTVEGNAAGVTAALLDRLIGVTGFSVQMAKVGWLVIHEDGISLPNFERHNGKTAKDRALTAKRVSEHKANAKANGQVTVSALPTALPREEKRREEVIPPNPPAGGAFDRFWSEWPKHKRKVAEDQCRAKWKAKGCESIADQVIDAVKAFKASDDWRKDGGEFIPAPLVWLNQGRWAAAPALKQEAAAVGVAQAESFLSQQRALDAEINTPEARERARQAAALLKNVVKRVA